MNQVLISSGSRYPINRRNIAKTVLEFLKEIGLDETEISIVFVGRRKIRELNNKWRNLDEETTVLTFGLEEPRDNEEILRIGDIVISYPAARDLAQDENLLVQQAIDKLLVHGLNNLLKSQKNANNVLSKVSAANF